MGTHSHSPARTPHVLVVGGGFGGAYAARALLRRTRGRVAVTIVSSTNFLLFTPLLPEAACGAIEPRHVVVPLRQMLPGAQLVVGTVVAVDAAAKRVRVQMPEGPDRELAYDRLVLAPGGAPRVVPVPGLAEHAVGVKTLAEGIWLRNHTIDMLERAESEPDSVVRRQLLSFTFVGGGYAGVEYLAELQNMVQRIMRYYPGIEPGELSWLLVDAGPGILRELGGDLGEYARQRLMRRGIRVLNDTTLSQVTATSLTLSSGEVVPCRTLVWAAGVVPAPLVATLGAPVDRGRLVVDGQLRVSALGDVWALGDSAAVPNARTGTTDPPTSQHALRQAKRAGRNVAASLGFGVAEPYGFRPLGGLATLGVGDGVAQIMRLRTRGLLAWFAARTYHLLAIPSFSKRVRVALDWTLQLVTPYDIVQVGQLGHPRRIDDPWGTGERSGERTVDTSP